jgi:hypothetical protein
MVQSIRKIASVKPGEEALMTGSREEVIVKVKY